MSPRFGLLSLLFPPLSAVERYSVFLLPGGSPVCLFGQASSICNVRPHRRAFSLQLVIQDL